MIDTEAPSISAVVAAYQAERWIAEALESILSQTHPPDEVIVVDDGSTDGTARELQRFADRIRIVRQPNRGCPAAFNTAFSHARGDFVAMCGADDVWEPRKLEWQIEAIQAHPEADVLFGHALLIGRVRGDHARPPAAGLLDSERFRNAMFKELSVCAPSVVIRRSLFDRLGPFVEDFGADDYEYWFRCLRAGARFYYDPRPLLQYRQHTANLSAKRLWMDQCSYEVRRRYRADITDGRLVDETLAPLLFRLARELVDSGRPGEARRAFRHSLRYAAGNGASTNLRALAWIAVLGLPVGARARVTQTVVGLRRSVQTSSRRRSPALT